MKQQSRKIVSHWISANGLRMHSRRSPEGLPANRLPLILVHGLTVSSRYMVPIAQRLAPFYSIYAPDLPGFGKSASPAHVLTIPELADALADWMQACGIASAALMGQSMGCQVIADLALRYPDRVSAAVLIGPSMDRHGRTALEQIRRLCIDGTRTPLSSLFITFRDLLDCGVARTLKTFQYALRDQIETKLPSVSAPTLILRGERDPIAPQRWVCELRDLLPHGQLQIIPGASHAAQYMAPERTAQVMLPFLESVYAGVL